MTMRAGGVAAGVLQDSSPRCSSPAAALVCTAPSITDGSTDTPLPMEGARSRAARPPLPDELLLGGMTIRRDAGVCAEDDGFRLPEGQTNQATLSAAGRCGRCCDHRSMPQAHLCDMGTLGRPHATQLQVQHGRQSLAIPAGRNGAGERAEGGLLRPCAGNKCPSPSPPGMPCLAVGAPPPGLRGGHAS